jgi:hypothetical protein
VLRAVRHPDDRIKRLRHLRDPGTNGDEIDRKGAGIVDEYDLDGTFLHG